jgi:hypothetical protein
MDSNPPSQFYYFLCCVYYSIHVMFASARKPKHRYITMLNMTQVPRESQDSMEMSPCKLRLDVTEVLVLGLGVTTIWDWIWGLLWARIPLSQGGWSSKSRTWHCANHLGWRTTNTPCPGWLGLAHLRSLTIHAGCGLRRISLKGPTRSSASFVPGVEN